MYISAELNYKTNEIVVWEETIEGRQCKRFEVPYYCYIEHPEGTYKGLMGETLKRYAFDTRDDFKQFVDTANQSGIKTFESDIPPELKVLSDHYYNCDTIPLKTIFFDIEVDYDPAIGFSTIEDPYAPINSVAVYRSWDQKCVVYVVPPEEWDGNLDPGLKKLAKIVLCKNEKELLLQLLENEIEPASIISGWNSDQFDVPMVCKRIEKTLGKGYLRKMSFPEGKMPMYRTQEIFGREVTLVKLSGRVHLDYMQLFKKFEAGERPSYKLEAIANEILPDLPKLEYEGSLANLYRTDFNHFVRYNIRDTEILAGFEEKCGYVDLANQMYHLSTGLADHIFGTIKLADLAIVNYCHYVLGVIVPDLSVSGESTGIQGALVFDPNRGKHDWIGSVDIASLYPSTIRAINISPETIVGQFDSNVLAFEKIYKQTDDPLTLVFDNGDCETFPAKQWRTKLLENHWSISGYGTVFDQKSKGVIPAILEDWYNKRKEFKNKCSDYKEKANAILQKYK